MATIGVRAEDIVLSATPAGGSDEGRVLVVEPMGSETLVTLEYRGQRLVARVAGDARFEPGQAAWVYLPPDRVLTFDASGDRI
jgi:multiple sugar transport system ATP-binding protein